MCRSDTDYKLACWSMLPQTAS